MVTFLIAGCYKEVELTSYEASDTTITNVITKQDEQGRSASLLSAFYGLDDALPKLAGLVVCKGAGGKDAMPVIFSHEIDVKSIQAGDFRITTASGKIGDLTCVTLAPADDMGEWRTVLLVGSFGGIDDQPVKVEVVGNVLSIDRTMNFKGASVQVIPLEKGPKLIWAEVVPEKQWELGKKATVSPFGGGSACPKGTKQVVRAVWSGGVSKPGGDEVDDKERLLYKVTVQKPDGGNDEITPFALGDLGDGDNNHELCFTIEGKPLTVSFPKGHMTDPREDLNPYTQIEMSN